MVYLSKKEQIGERIKSARLKKELTQEQLANILGVDYTLVGKLERGIHTPTQKIKKLADALECSEQYILHGESGSNSNLSINDTIQQIRHSLWLSEQSANVLFNACLYSMDNIDFFFKNIDFLSLTDKTNLYMYYCSLENDSSIPNKELIREKKNNILAEIIAIINNAAASCDSSEINALYKDSIYTDSFKPFYMPNLSNTICKMIYESNFYSMLRTKQLELITNYLAEQGYNKEAFSNMDSDNLIMILIDAFWKDTRNSEVIAYRKKGNECLLYNGEDLTEQLRQYACELYDSQISPRLNDYLSDKLIIEQRRIFLDNINIHSFEYNPYQIQ